MSLQELVVQDFTGGLNLERNQFSIRENESGDMLNVTIDASSGISTRYGWTRWNAADVVATPTGSNWDPRNCVVHQHSDGGYSVLVANGSTVYYAMDNAVFANMSITAGADTHIADFAPWGDYCYMALGRTNASYHWDAVTELTTSLTDAATSFNDTYTTPVGGCAPRGELVETHGQYLFWANLRESSTNYPNRIRWSHPGNPEDYATNDYIDIDMGGGKITAIKSFNDHLVIFKTDSVWALYGYDLDSWQLIQVHRSLGTPSPASVGRGPGALYFYSAGTRPGVYAYTGTQNPVYITENIETPFKAIETGFASGNVNNQDDVYVGWSGRRLWVNIPWTDENAGSYPGTTFMLDLDVGNGAWSMHRPALGRLGPVAEGAEVEIGYPCAFIHGSSGAAALLELDQNSIPKDAILADETLSTYPSRYRTAWFFGGPTMEDKKSWLRPTFLVGIPPSDVIIDVDFYCDCNEASPTRSHQISIDSGNSDVTWNSFNWNDGTLWSGGSEIGASKFTRTVSGSSIGTERAVSAQFVSNDNYLGVPWQVDGIVFKYRPRKRTT